MPSTLSLTYLGNNLDKIGGDNEQKVYSQRVDLIVPILLNKFKTDPTDKKGIDSLIDSLMSAALHGKYPMFQYLLRALEIIESSDSEDININFLNQEQIDFIVNNLNVFKEVIQYLVIGNRNIELDIDEETYRSAEQKTLVLFVEFYNETLTKEAIKPLHLLDL